MGVQDSQSVDILGQFLRKIADFMGVIALLRIKCKCIDLVMNLQYVIFEK